jgi:hypothetical protein
MPINEVSYEISLSFQSEGGSTDLRIGEQIKTQHYMI